MEAVQNIEKKDKLANALKNKGTEIQLLEKTLKEKHSYELHVKDGISAMHNKNKLLNTIFTMTIIFIRLFFQIANSRIYPMRIL